MLLRVGFASASHNPLAIAAIRAFASFYPGWRVVMVQSTWHDPTSGVASGLADLGFARLPTFSGEVEEIPLAEEPHWLALPSGHDLAGRDEVGLAELADEPSVALPAAAGSWRDWWLLAHLRPDASPPRIAA